jgi:hypothetical protein
MQLGNPSVTSPRQGDRSRASRVSPGNATGRLYARQHEEAKRAAASIDVAAIRKAAWSAGFQAGHEAGWSAAIAWVQENFDVYDKDDADDQDSPHGEVEG